MIQRTIKLHTGVEKTLNSTKIITKTEWQKAAEKLYGSDVKQWRFKCPICGKILVAILLRMDFWEFLMVVM